MFPLKHGLLITCVLTLGACGNNAQLQSKLESVSQCIQAPDSINQSYDLAVQEDRIPVYLSPDNRDKYSNADWYKTNEPLYEGISWDLEDWSTLSDLSECDQALGDLEADYPKNESVKQMRRFLGFSQTAFKKYHEEQVEDAAFELLFTLEGTQECLIINHYPQAFILNEYELERGFWAGGFSIDWDGDDISRGTSTADGRNPLWRPIKSVKSTHCLKSFEALSPSYIDWVLSVDDKDIISWSEYSEYKVRFEEITQAVEAYNEIVTEQHEKLKAAGEAIPSMGSYTPPIIHKIDLGYVSDYDFKQLIKTCESTPPKTFVNGRGETLTSQSQECSLVQTLCNKYGIEPPLDEKACELFVYK